MKVVTKCLRSNDIAWLSLETWSTHICFQPYFQIIINAWVLKISVCGKLTANFKLHLNAFKKGGPPTHEFNLRTVLFRPSGPHQCRWVNTIACMCTSERMFSYVLVCFVFSEYYDSSIVCVFHAGSSHNKRHASQPLRYEHMQCVNILFTSVVIQNFMRKWIRELKYCLSQKIFVCCM